MFSYIILEGGETFLYKPLPELLDRLCKFDNLLNTTIITNGTVLPNKRLISSLKNPKITVRISDYGNTAKRDEIIKTLEENGINYMIQIQKWSKLSSFTKEPKSGNELKQVINNCCKQGGKGGGVSVYCADSKLFTCPIHGNLHNTGIYPSNENDYIDLRQPDSPELQEKIEKYLRGNHAPEICRHCNGRGYTGIEVPPAEQLAKGEEMQVIFE